MVQMKMKLNLVMMMGMKNIHIKKLLRVLSTIQKEDTQKLIVIGKEKKLHNINQIQNVKDAKVIGLKMRLYV